MNDNPDPKYILIELNIAKELARAVRDSEVEPNVRAQIDRIEAETGGDFREIARLLQDTEICWACRIEGRTGGQLMDCTAPHTKKLGRRLRRLIDRADASDRLNFD